ncbi:MAG: hypothetical protein KJ757_03860 [Planctomycetes bacterium]|nr:hypothetical protein [Planctomycetota bacterium]MBU1518491.1 hypothetical protein [Planctomycetota bacterium]MBU2457404.1 hypothetical protein [Planctomycetota bacterium]MBU2596680.1 hypothetical protein [Planctomycetota bacterium]
MAVRNISITVTVVFVFLLLLGITVYLGFQNRNSEALRSKVFTAIAIAVIGGLFTIWFSLESKRIELKFISTLFFHKSDKKPLDLHFSEQHKYGGHQFDINLLNFINKYVEQNGEINKAAFDKDTERISDFYHNLILIKLISNFFWTYADWWDIDINSSRRGYSVETEVSAIKPKPAYSTLEWGDFLKTLKTKDELYQLLTSFSKDSHFKKIAVPPKTKINLITSNYSKTLILTNPFVRVSITIDKRGGSLGLGDYQWLLGCNDNQNREFWSEYFRINCKAEFEKLKSGHPEMPRYKRWVETMFAEVRRQLDEKERLKRAHEYRNLISLRN